MLKFLSVTTAVLLPVAQLRGAGIEIRPGTIAEFASAEEGRQILAERETGFIQSMSQFDRRVRMRTARTVSEGEFVTYLTNQVRAWTSTEQMKVTAALNQIRAQLQDLNVPMPSQFFLVKTTGGEEGNAAYLRASAIILPQSLISGDAAQLTKTLTHELFHEYLYHNPHLKRALYGIIGFQLCNEIALPQVLVDSRITSPNPSPWDFFIRVESNGERIPCLLIFYSKSTNYTGGQLFDYLQFRLLALEERDGRYYASCSPEGVPRLLDTSTQVQDYHEQIGCNTSYIIHPEEILADNFVVVAGKSNVLTSPRVPYLLRKAINSPGGAMACMVAGRFGSILTVPTHGKWAIEGSTDLVEWTVCAYLTNTSTSVPVLDLDAWLHATRFYRARTLHAPTLLPGDTNNMVWIPPGTFLMGSSSIEVGYYLNEGPQRQVTLTRGFWMGKYEITQAEYEAIMSSDPSYFRGWPDLPVESVTWNDATNYCFQLTALELAAGRLPADHVYRLPTEAEWEYAARAGTTTRYSFGDDPDYTELFRHEWCRENAQGHTHPVGLKPANPWGLHDMHAHLAEWCSDWYATYPAGSAVDPQGPTTGTRRVLRGCAYSWWSPVASRSAARSRLDPSFSARDVGFRIVLAPASP